MDKKKKIAKRASKRGQSQGSTNRPSVLVTDQGKLGDEKPFTTHLQGALRKVQDNAFQRVARCAMKTTNLYIHREVLPRDHVINAQHQKIRLKENTLMVFADDAPLLNWAHPCRYLLYKADSGELYDEVPATFPPHLVDPPSAFQLYHEQVPVVRVKDTWHIRREFYPIYAFPTGSRYAVLFSGASNNRHTNDLEFLYRTLIDIYHFRPKNIYVLNYDGTIDYSGTPKPVANWPGDNTPYRMPINGKGTKADLEGVFNELKTRLKKNDFLLIHTNNHGGYSGASEAYLCTYSGPSYFANEFANKVGELPKFSCLMAMMEQCHSGGFNAPIISKSTASSTSVASACVATANSRGGSQFDPFARDWISGMAGANPYGAALVSDPDLNNNGRVTAREAFDYADSIHDPYDTPVLSEAGSGGMCNLGTRWGRPWYWPIIAEALDPYWRRPGPDPGPEFHLRVEQELIPRLERAGIETEMDKRLQELQRDLEPRIKDIVKEAMGK